ncbi:Rid family hydrolase, partial [Enterobacteriaceae endosymbiont of Donacia semicuprea]|uniref:Rid family hydrolase n=1 Tax=Enterobacteriaceae endosymbiont of Donacia semicuprea TaxID=2675783 RepID=UPI001B3A897D
LFIMKKIIFTKKYPISLDTYSQEILLKNIFFISGKIFINLINDIIPLGINKKNFQVLKNIKYILKKIKFFIKNIIKTIIFLKNLDNYDKINIIYQNYFLKNTINYLTKICLEVFKLPKNIEIKIEAIAIKI